MRQFLRKWLGVPSIDHPKDFDTSVPITEAKIRELIGRCLHDALDGKSDFEGLWSFSYLDLTNTLNRALERAAHDPAVETARQAIADLTEPEAFIDKVVERIRRKQLTA